jgi:predicted NUDIX family NTP pyrophosphohydrolase
MAVRHSAGLLPWRRGERGVELFLVHMAGPYWAHKDDGAWSIAKGEYDPGVEDPWQVAQREFTEEVGLPAPPGDPIDIGEHRMPSGKRVRVFLVRTDLELHFVSSNLFEMEWPRGSGTIAQFPETDDAQWFALERARHKLVSGQVPILDLVIRALP